MSNVSSIALPYAEALLASSKALGLISKTNKDLLLISRVLSQSKALENFLVNPLLGIDTKKNVLRQLLLDKVDNHVLVFLFILVERRRMILINTIIDCYTNLVNKSESTIIANISTAIALTNVQRDTLENKLKYVTNSKLVKLVIDINPDLIGGLVIKIGSKIIDTSLLGQLNRMTSHLSIVQR
uniref:ATP synthase CF1 delta subunit n=1 Tax=Sporolithon durum TaxID=48970 RepID=A0A141SCU2_9FLOR|nr:ATP synthase CF1 delta subunit [Sporolithon durum]AMK96110.1 ATP synthase CF1 delta subunit [Sporolithon durum]